MSKFVELTDYDFDFCHCRTVDNEQYQTFRYNDSGEYQ